MSAHSAMFPILGSPASEWRLPSPPNGRHQTRKKYDHDRFKQTMCKVYLYGVPDYNFGLTRPWDAAAPTPTQPPMATTVAQMNGTLLAEVTASKTSSTPDRIWPCGTFHLAGKCKFTPICFEKGIAYRKQTQRHIEHGLAAYSTQSGNAKFQPSQQKTPACTRRRNPRRKKNRLNGLSDVANNNRHQRLDGN